MIKTHRIRITRIKKSNCTQKINKKRYKFKSAQCVSRQAKAECNLCAFVKFQTCKSTFLHSHTKSSEFIAKKSTTGERKRERVQGEKKESSVQCSSLIITLPCVHIFRQVIKKKSKKKNKRA